MRFLVDADLGHAIAQSLLERGHDVLRAATALGPSAEDPDVASRAVKENRHIVTGDKNFVWQLVQARLHFPHAILDLRPVEPALARHFVMLLNRVLEEGPIRDGFHYIVQPHRTRIARIPCP